MSTPILLLSDCPSQSSGLARITRDLATVLASMPEFRVATLGWLGTGSVRFPFHTYHMAHDEYGERTLPLVWEEFSQGQAGIVMTVWDATRVLWLAQPDYCESPLRDWLVDARRRKFKFWAYLPFDATGPGDRFTGMAREVLLGVDRILVPSPWALDVVRRTIGRETADARGATFIPHGINDKTFTPAPVGAKTSPLIGCVMTNQVRKDAGLWAATCAGLAERLKGNVRFWLHIDKTLRHWSIDALVADYGLGEYVDITTPPSDDKWLAEMYRRCDVTFLPSTGEGFGYPLFESLACGTPVVHGDYAGGASVMRTCGLDDLLVAPEAWRLETIHNQVRPVFNPSAFVEKILDAMDSDVSGGVDHLAWRNLSHVWKRWFKEGLGE